MLAGDDDSIHAVSSQPVEPGVTDRNRVEWHRADLRRPRAARELITSLRPSHLVHLAWNTDHGLFWNAPDNIAWLQGSLELIRSFEERGTRLVTIGSCAEYDWSDGWCDEQVTPLRPATLYGACKLSLAVVARTLCAQREVSAAHARIFQLYGSAESPKRLVASVVDSCLRGEAALCSDGTQIRDFLHAQDVARALVALLDSDVLGPVNIGSGQPVSLREIVTLVGQLTGRSDLIRLGALPMRSDDPPVLLPRVCRLFDEVGWRPQIGLHFGLEATITERRRQLETVLPSRA